ncbi:MAG: hypothetical protein A2Y38_00390 [Spirochaetes bacterium GWB1_59_5]|nr:MAG: hypothetical protein A2Y38_00390 [Spirochaetes bacterium GWB1_59_5]
MTEETRKFRQALLDVWERTVDLDEVQECPGFTEFNGATLSLLRDLGLEYDVLTEQHVFQNPPDQPCVKCGGDQRDGSTDIEVGSPCSLCGWVR